MIKRRSVVFWGALITLLLWQEPYLSAERYPRGDSSAVFPTDSLNNMIFTAAIRQGVNPALVEAIVAVESGFNPRAVSPKGAIGLMQLMPQTASRYGVSDPFDPQENLAGGTRYLRDLLRLFDGDFTKVLAAYNAGENAVLRYRGLPPYRETRDYVRKVLARYQPDPVSPSFPSVVRRRDASPVSRGINSVKGKKRKTASYRPLTRLSPPPLVRMRVSRTVSIKLPVHRYYRIRPTPAIRNLSLSSSTSE